MTEIEIDKKVFLECYWHLLAPNDFDIELLYGGRDSGKSKYAAQYLLKESLSLDYFRCVLFKKTHESIKDSQWQMLQEVADTWEVDEFFQFKTSPLSIDVENGNTFLTRGMDKPAKIRSITNPSHAWIEEGNQLTEDDFITILTGMRSDHGRVKIFITFNPEVEDGEFEDFWLYKMFFEGKPEGSFESEFIMKVFIRGEEQEIRLRYRATHTTYPDNPYCTPQRIAFHESLSRTNPYWYNVYTLGRWGNKQNDSPWVYAFSREKHVASSRLQAVISMPLIISFDFNRNPMATTLIQWPGTPDAEIKVLKVYKIPNMGVDGICDLIMRDYPGFLYLITGDYTGNTASTMFADPTSNYTIIRKKLNLSSAQIKIAPNPLLKHNQTLVNLVLQYLKVQIDPVEGKPMVFDFENVRGFADGSIDKGDGTSGRKDSKKQADVLDTWRYFCNMFCRELLKRMLGEQITF